jgi:hypothetical protein
MVFPGLLTEIKLWKRLATKSKIGAVAIPFGGLAGLLLDEAPIFAATPQASSVIYIYRSGASEAVHSPQPSTALLWTVSCGLLIIPLGHISLSHIWP